MNKDRAAAVAASAWNAFEAAHGRRLALTPAEMLDEIEEGDRNEVIHRLRWYAAHGGGLYCSKDAQDAISEYEGIDQSGCPECERSFGPHYRGPCSH